MFDPVVITNQLLALSEFETDQFHRDTMFEFNHEKIACRTDLKKKERTQKLLTLLRATLLFTLLSQYLATLHEQKRNMVTCHTHFSSYGFLFMSYCPYRR